MARIYIHIPFCRKACAYCNFHFSTLLKNKESIIEALLVEISLREDFFANKTLDSIYFGGGTPSLLSENELARIFDKLRTHFTIKNNAEITLEINPDDCSKEYLNALKKVGFNRLSIGIQSFHDKDLEYLGRVHNALQSHQIIQEAKKAGFDNLTVDLIYGLPSSNTDQWKNNLQFIKEYQIPHFSAYAITIEPKTLLENRIKKGKMQEPEEAKYEEDFSNLLDFADRHGFDHYEISNFSLDHYMAFHNTSYWFGEPFLGIGPGAHSFDGYKRKWNIANNARYEQSLNKGVLPLEEESLTEKEKFNETVMTGLRTKWGLDLSAIYSEYGRFYHDYLDQKLRKWEAKGALKTHNGHYYLQSRQTLLADHIIADCFYVA